MTRDNPTPKPTRPLLDVLSPGLVDTILAEAHAILETYGITTPNEAALELAEEHGLPVDRDEGRVRMGLEVVARCVASAPDRVTLYGRSGQPAMDLGAARSHFNPGSAAIAILDPRTKHSRPPTLTDVARFAMLTDRLPHLAGQSTGLVPGDVAQGDEDWMRLLLALLYGDKPIVTGTFRRGSLAIMRELLLAVRGTDEALRERPLAVFDCCPSPPLRWGDHIAQDVIDAARWGIPVEFVSMPALGSVAPVSLLGALIQHTAETLSYVVLSQLAAPGAPVVYGGSPSLFDMRHQTTPMSAVESILLMCGQIQMGRHLGLPTHAYMGLADSKLVDAQAGAETMGGAALGVLAGANNVSGPGMLELESCLSLEKLALDNDICGMALQLARGIEPLDGDLPSLGLFGELLRTGHLVESDHTMRHFRRHFYPDIIDRDRRSGWLARGGRTAEEAAADRVRELLAEEPSLPEASVVRDLLGVFESHARGAELPALPGISG